MSAPWLGWYGDDFTGATDTLATLARRGLRALLFLDVPDESRLARAGALDAVGIAGAARSMEPPEMVTALAPVSRFFAALGVRVMHYKCCSTFDSAPHVGSIGVAAQVLRADFPNAFLPILGGQPGLGRYCLFGHLFAAAGTGGAVHRIDRHPTMSIHPVTPMQEADLRRHLAAQGLSPIASLPYPAYGQAPEALAAIMAGGPSAVLLDVSRDEDLAPIGRLIRKAAEAAPLLAIGPSSVAEALALEWPDQAAAPPPPRAPGPAFVMVGSLSPVTRAQLEASPSFERLQAEPGMLIEAGSAARALVAEAAARLRAGRPVLVATTPPSDAVRLPAGAVARATARFVAALMAEAPVRRLGIAGGDTSSLGAQALDLWGLSYLDTLAPGVTLCRGHSDNPALDGIELMLKGGQMGPPDLFERFAA
ncbi:four-carbon acid sugar kinase family protein [Acetobacteraceae bacterium H6797]|nr:four-carbon acid sugar kinase family protein [Acetobacteraceae bacterium H6797]